jgi:ankyrin repeat protein
MPVHAAAAFGETDCLKALLDNGATVADRTKFVCITAIVLINFM